jgi:hypothetical protein
MKICLLVALVGLAIGVAQPVFAEQTDTPDPRQRLLWNDLCSGGRCFEEADGDLEFNPSTGSHRHSNAVHNDNSEQQVVFGAVRQTL